MQKKYKTNLLQTAAVVTLLAAFNVGFVSNTLAVVACNAQLPPPNVPGMQYNAQAACIQDNTATACSSALNKNMGAGGSNSIAFINIQTEDCGGDGSCSVYANGVDGVPNNFIAQCRGATQTSLKRVQTGGTPVRSRPKQKR